MQLISDNRSNSSLVVWRLLDGKPGHEHQSLGLVNEMRQRLVLEVIDLPVGSGGAGWLYLAAGVWPAGKQLPKPDMIIGAGHATHGHMLAAKRAYGGRTVCMMQPSLPAEMFDVCLIPEHDQYRGFSSFIETRGVINHIQPADAGKKGNSDVLIMIGGPSKHFHWDELGVIAQVYDLVRKSAEIHFVLTTSRRTPASFVSAMHRVSLTNLTIIPIEETGKDWVQSTLARVSSAWVTEDSVSMVYEALTAQVAVGLINLSAKGVSRVSLGIEKLIDRQLVARYDPYGLYRQYMRPVLGFNEASRCSDALLSYFYFNRTSTRGRLVSRLTW
ncbi:mitochondrial fission ELM1 family protein [Methylophilus aquaticus]|uniref:ELM1/GtrOC1 family putative glycosyltransferase n=1 Tax=Methylophilus aquaticus TaxID=1971610 RepID=A0ABT9JTR1_9PROT|nr:ELM1/GtrOC1 family putative glycosyltransferase [Methylophilus aquaticus]MDP8567977.1 ELM1/GtrOC1 family putative glycosyltransferase [Methylophilus aquaticus]